MRPDEWRVRFHPGDDQDWAQLKEEIGDIARHNDIEEQSGHCSQVRLQHEGEKWTRSELTRVVQGCWRVVLRATGPQRAEDDQLDEETAVNEGAVQIVETVVVNVGEECARWSVRCPRHYGYNAGRRQRVSGGSL